MNKWLLSWSMIILKLALILLFSRVKSQEQDDSSFLPSCELELDYDSILQDEIVNADVTIFNNLQDDILAWQVVYRFIEFEEIQIVGAEKALLLSPGTVSGAPARFVNEFGDGSMVGSGGFFSYSFSAALTDDAASDNSTTPTTGIRQVYLNGLKCNRRNQDCDSRSCFQNFCCGDELVELPQVSPTPIPQTSPSIPSPSPPSSPSPSPSPKIRTTSKVPWMIIVPVAGSCLILVSLIMFLFYKFKKKSPSNNFLIPTPFAIKSDEKRTLTFVPHQFQSASTISKRMSLKEEMQSDTRCSGCLDIEFEKEIILGDKIGSGAFGSVYEGTWKQKQVAVKVFHHSAHAELQSLKQEVKVLSKLRHPNIVSFLGYSLEPPNICIVEELAQGGSLANKIKKQKTNYQQILSIALDISKAMVYLHPSVVHRDLKPQNVLLDECGRAQVCDFGIAKFKNKTFLTTKNVQAGTPNYMAPELFEGVGVNEKVDVYAFGMVLWEMFEGRQPWQEVENPVHLIFLVAIQQTRPPISQSCPYFLRNLIQECWTQNAADRPSFKQILDRINQELILLDL